jgi:hypothetical protein
MNRSAVRSAWYGGVALAGLLAIAMTSVPAKAQQRTGPAAPPRRPSVAPAPQPERPALVVENVDPKELARRFSELRPEQVVEIGGVRRTKAQILTDLRRRREQIQTAVQALDRTAKARFQEAQAQTEQAEAAARPTGSGQVHRTGVPGGQRATELEAIRAEAIQLLGQWYRTPRERAQVQAKAAVLLRRLDRLGIKP